MQRHHWVGSWACAYTAIAVVTKIATTQKAGMSLKDYVIGGMDRDFKRKLYNALRAMAEPDLRLAKPADSAMNTGKSWQKATRLRRTAHTMAGAAAAAMAMGLRPIS